MTSTALAQKKELNTLLQSRVEDFSQALAGRIDPQAFLRVAYTSVSKNTALQRCSPASIMMSLLEAASLGLNPNGVMGEAYLIPYGQDAQLQVGYRGLVKLARQSGLIRTITPRAVFEGEEFSVEYGTNEHIHHVPVLDADTDTKTPLFVYAIAEFTDGSKQFEVMSVKAVEKVRARSKSKNSGPWVSDFTEMALKTVVRRLCKRLPLSDFDLARALEIENSDFDVSADTGSAAPKTGAAGLRDRLRTMSQQAAAQEEQLEEAQFEVIGEEQPA